MGGARKPEGELRTGFTTGACAAAASLGAAWRLWTGERLRHAQITLPKGQTPVFELVEQDAAGDWARAGVVKDAGDDPDVTHGATIIATLRPAAQGAGLSFKAGAGVGMVTKPGLPIPPGEPAINPAPRLLIAETLAAAARGLGRPEAVDMEVEISVPGGAAIAKKTWNPRLGVLGGLSILGTTGVVRPFSCAAWIASIHRGVDVARADGLTHAIAVTGSTSEALAASLYPDAPEWAFLDMGDFAGGLLKYLRRHPLPRLTIAGGFAKLTKLAQGAMDLHSGRSQVDFEQLARWTEEIGGDAAAVRDANTAMAALEIAGDGLAALVARQAQAQALIALAGAPVAIEALAVSRDGRLLARTGFAP